MPKKETQPKNIAAKNIPLDIRWNRNLWLQLVLCCLLIQLGFIITIYRIPQVVTHKVSLLLLVFLYLLIGFRYTRLKMVYASRKGHSGPLWAGLGIACGVGFLVLSGSAYFTTFFVERLGIDNPETYKFWIWRGMILMLLGEWFIFLLLWLVAEKPKTVNNLPALWEEKLAHRIGITSEEKQYRSWPRWIWIGCLVLVLTAALHSSSKCVGGGDTWVAMACGRYTLDSAAKDQPNRTWQMKVLDWLGIHTTQQEPLGARTREFNPESRKFKNISKRSCGTIKEAVKDAFSSEKDKDREQQIKEIVQAYNPELDDVGWVNQNWLTHVLFYKMKTAFGGDEYKSQKGEFLIVIYKFIQAVLTALFVYWAARVMGAHPLIAASAVAFGMLLSRSFIDLRPNISSIFFAAIMILLISYWKKGRHWALAGMIPVMILWSNVHGGFIYAIMIFGILLVGHAIQCYAGKINYAFLLLGLLVLIVFFILGTSSLKSERKVFDKQRDNIEQYIKFQGYKLKPAELMKYQSNLAYFRQKANTLRIYEIAGGLAASALALITVFSLLHLSKIKPDSFHQAGKRGLKFIAAATGYLVLSPVIFSPFGLENLAHPLVIAVGKEGKQWREVIEWKPIWNPQGFGNEGPYQIFLLLFAFAAVAWFILYFLKPHIPEAGLRRKKQKPIGQFYWPKVDLAQIAIIAITLVMSVKSRRFIFLGGVIIAPFLAAMIQEIIHMAHILWRHKNNLPKQILPKRNLILAVATILSLFPIGHIGWEFHQYMEKTYQYKKALFDENVPLQSIFRRMVGIGDQPVSAMQFFNQHRFQGVVYNEWTHGGFVSFHQIPVAETGEPPCKVFMDGRAQAAYTLKHYKYWSGFSQDAGETSVSAKAFSQKLRRENINMAVLDIAERELSTKGKPAYDKLIASGEWLSLFNNSRYAVLAAIGDDQNREKIQNVLQTEPRALMLSTCSTPLTLKRFFVDQHQLLQQCYLKHPRILVEPFIKVKQGRKNLLNNPQALNILFQDHPQDLKSIFLKHTNILHWLIINQFSALEQIFQKDTQFLKILQTEKNRIVKPKSGK